ncbi:Cilia- and flagella-associated protein 44 [Bulinus truncatus]|nr:Cilia- and flagella-associated protein 44 [Bulinus truncatus]
MKEELMTVGADGYIRVWDFETIDTADATDDSEIFTYHAGPISSCVTSTCDTSCCVNWSGFSTVRVYDYIQMKQLAEAKFTSGGTAISWVPISVDPKGGSVVVGFMVMVLRVLATGSVDGTVFSCMLEMSMTPIGFIKVPGPVRQLVWTPEKFKKAAVMVVCEDGVVVEVESPEPGNFDTSHSYEISGLSMKTYKFKSIKSYLRHEEELERLRLEEEANKKKEEEERRKRIERGLETESQNGEAQDLKPKTPLKEWHPFIPKEPSQILYASYSEEEGTFWLSMGDFDAGYLYECKFTSPEEQALMMPDNIDKPLKAVPVLESEDVPIQVVHYSNNGQWVFFGLANGQVRVQQLEEPRDLAQLGPQWTLSIHDNTYGQITSVVTSFDGSVVLTCGADGNFFQFLFMSQEELEEKIRENKAKLPSARKVDLLGKPIDDIDDPNAYSIEDAKQKSEYDKRMKEAEYKKKEVRKKINQMRRQFRTIIEQNENLPKHLQLGRMEFEMDREIKQELERQTQEKIEIVRKELAWESEKLRISLDKLRKRFKECVECERFLVKAFTTSHQVASFRASKLSDDFYQLKSEFERKKTKMTTKDDSSSEFKSESQNDQDTLDAGEKLKETAVGDDSGSKVTTILKGSVGERIMNALQKIEDKKRKRAYRKSQWEELYSSKPDDNYEDPMDVAAIKEAQENMGDYKLKTAKDYVVPDHLRMNVEKAQWRLIIIKDLIHQYKYDFNVRLLALRDKKIQVINEIKNIVAQLKEIHSHLDPERHLPVPDVPELSVEEMPEKSLEYDREILLKFKVEYEIKQRHATTDGGQTSAGNVGGFGFGFGGGNTVSQEKNGLDAEMEENETATAPTQTVKQTVKVSAKEKENEVDSNKVAEEKEEDTSTELEKELQRIEQIRLAYEQSQLIQHIQNLMLKFDAELRLLRHDKFKLDVTMLDADLRQVTLFEELVLLKEYEKREDILADKVVIKEQEKADMQLKILEIQGKIDLKKKDIEKLQEKEKGLMAQFTQSLGENNKFAEYLTKVFKKRVKRTKKKATDGADSDEDSDSDSSDESEWEESDEESDSEVGGYDLDVCPPGCDQKLYDDTCMLREKRLDIEDALTEEKKMQNGQKKSWMVYRKS